VKRDVGRKSQKEDRAKNISTPFQVKPPGRTSCNLIFEESISMNLSFCTFENGRKQSWVRKSDSDDLLQGKKKDAHKVTSNIADERFREGILL
jgi:hypothetical protein